MLLLRLPLLLVTSVIAVEAFSSSPRNVRVESKLFHQLGRPSQEHQLNLRTRSWVGENSWEFRQQWERSCGRQQMLVLLQVTLGWLQQMK
jgi:hypothetical protein